MKIKTYIFLFFISLSHFGSGQTSGSGSVDLKIFFEKGISIKNIDVFYIEHNGSGFENISYSKNETGNSLNIKGYHHWWGAPSFSTIAFRYKEEETIFMFYLVSSYSPPYIRDKFNEKILFSFETPNAQISRNNNNQRSFTVDYISKGYNLSFPMGINEMIKIESLQ